MSPSNVDMFIFLQKNMSLITGSTLCLKHLMGCFREKILLDEAMTCQFTLCCFLGISLPRDTVEFVKEHCIEFIHPITVL